jgi:hypothetical protein
MECKNVPASLLPEGWHWIMFEDGSGSLVSPKGVSYYSYDIASYWAEKWMEYKKDSNSSWDIFYGELNEFKKYAERCIKGDKDYGTY